VINPASPNFKNTPSSLARPGYAYLPLNQESPAVTIITPFYNVPPAIFSETAKTVLSQSFQQWEWLIINDGSSDTTALTIYRNGDPRIRVLDHDHHGPSAARNLGFREASTEFIVMLDADDLLEPTAIEKWFWFLVTHHEASFVKGYSVGFGSHEYLWANGFELGKRFLTENCITQTSMVRRAVWQQTGGFDEHNQAGLEDWEFWIRAAAQGYWGRTIPEYLDWYRRRPNHGERWPNWNGQDNVAAFRDQLQKKYPHLYERDFPKVARPQATPYTPVSTAQPCANLIANPTRRKRILMLLPWLVTGGADKFNLDLVKGLANQDYDISICTTLPSDNPWLAYFADITPDIFNLPNFLESLDFPRFLLYLINSRQIETVFISNSYLGYQLLPFLRAHCPQITFVDYTHIEEPHWRSGGHARASISYQELLDLNIVSSQYLKQWQVEQGATAEQIEVCYTNIDPNEWHSANFERTSLRHSLGIPLEQPLILYAGRIVPQKRPQIFAEIIRRLAIEEKLDFYCLVAGDGIDLPFLRKFVNHHHLQNHVHFLGEVLPGRMKELQAIANIFLLPSAYEGISLAIYEAMAMETVTVGAVVGGQRELVTPECGYLISHNPQEIEEYTDALKQLILSPQLRQEMATAGRERIIKHFSLDKMVQRMIELFDQAQTLARRSPRPSVGRGLGLACATQVIEYHRLEHEHNQAWSAIQRLSAEKDILWADLQRFAKNKSTMKKEHLTPEQVLQDIQAQLTEPAPMVSDSSLANHIAQARQAHQQFRAQPVLGALAGFKKLIYGLVHSTFSQQYNINDGLLNLIEELHGEVEKLKNDLP